MAHDGFEDGTNLLDQGALRTVVGVMGRRRNDVGKRNGASPISSLQLLSKHWEGIGLPPYLKLLLSWQSDGLELPDDARGLPGCSCTMSTKGLSMGRFRQRQCSSSSGGVFG